MQCAICKKPVDMSKENKFRPFCSERCQMVDLGTWASGGYEPDTDDDTQDHEHPDDLKKRRTLH